MALWVIRAGRQGERENFALENNVAVIGWDEMRVDLGKYKNRQELHDALKNMYPDRKPNAIGNWAGQLWSYVHEIAKGDLIAMPMKNRGVIYFGEVTGDYSFRSDFPEHSQHSRPVKWIKEIPRTQFDPDLLYSFGGLSTIFRVKRNNAEKRVRELLEGKKTISSTVTLSETSVETSEVDNFGDLEQYARDQISEYIDHKFKGHGLARLVAAILEAQGYKVNISPEGPDGGIDILAGSGSLGFDQPRMVVQVKSSNTPIEVNVVRELSGVMTNFGADHGLIVSWGGFRGTVEKEAARSFFKIRLWDAEDLVRTIQQYYEKLPDDIQAELPLKRIWMLVREEED